MEEARPRCASKGKPPSTLPWDKYILESWDTCLLAQEYCPLIFSGGDILIWRLLPFGLITSMSPVTLRPLAAAAVLLLLLTLSEGRNLAANTTVIRAAPLPTVCTFTVDQGTAAVLQAASSIHTFSGAVELLGIDVERVAVSDNRVAVIFQSGPAANAACNDGLKTALEPAFSAAGLEKAYVSEIALVPYLPHANSTDLRQPRSCYSGACVVYFWCRTNTSCARRYRGRCTQNTYICCC